jgi:hypothetical protein
MEVKYQREVLNPGACSHVQKIVPKPLKSMPGIVGEKMGFDKGHGHFLGLRRRDMRFLS